MRTRLKGLRIRVDLPRPRAWKRFMVKLLPTEASEELLFQAHIRRLTPES